MNCGFLWRESKRILGRTIRVRFPIQSIQWSGFVSAFLVAYSRMECISAEQTNQPMIDSLRAAVGRAGNWAKTKHWHTTSFHLLTLCRRPAPGSP